MRSPVMRADMEVQRIERLMSFAFFFHGAKLRKVNGILSRIYTGKCRGGKGGKLGVRREKEEMQMCLP